MVSLLWIHNWNVNICCAWDFNVGFLYGSNKILQVISISMKFWLSITFIGEMSKQWKRIPPIDSFASYDGRKFRKLEFHRKSVFLFFLSVAVSLCTRLPTRGVFYGKFSGEPKFNFNFCLECVSRYWVKCDEKPQNWFEVFCHVLAKRAWRTHYRQNSRSDLDSLSNFPPENTVFDDLKSKLITTKIETKKPFSLEFEFLILCLPYLLFSPSSCSL